MSLAREGLAAIALAGTVAAAVIATSVWRRSWPLWLLGYVMILVTAWIALAVSVTPAAGSAATRVASRPIDVIASPMSIPLS